MFYKDCIKNSFRGAIDNSALAKAGGIRHIK